MTDEKYTVEDFIPQRRPMLLVDEFVQATWTQAEVSTEVRDTWPLASDGQVDPVVLIELVAQTAGVLAGWRKREQEKQGGRGWLVGVRKTKIFIESLALGAKLRSFVQVAYEMESYAVFIGRVELDGEEIAVVEIQTFQPEDSFWSQETDDGE